MFSETILKKEETKEIMIIRTLQKKKSKIILIFNISYVNAQ